MVPKVIYFTWISDKPVPEKYRQYIESWSKVMPDYKVKQITLKNVKRGAFVDKAIAMKNYALAGHYARVQELYLNGGIYFDIDIEAVKPLDEFLNEKLVLGCEDAYVVNNAVIIAQAGHPFLKECMNFMDSFDFKQKNIELETGPRMFTNLMKKRGWLNGQYKNIGDIKILPPSYFYPYHYDEVYSPKCVRPETCCVHHWANSWNDKVSIIIPCYNQAQYLPDAIESALAQTYRNFEVIVVNDGSTDNTSKVAKRYPVKLIEQSNKGLSAARNAGIKKAEGGWILTLDSDDKIAPDFLEHTIGRDDIVSTTLQTFGTENHIWRSPKKNPVFSDFVNENHIHCCSLFKKDVWTKAGGFDEGMRDGYEDWDFWIRATQAGFSVTTVDKPLFFYRKRGKSMFSHAKANHDKNMKYMRAKYFKKVDLPDVTFIIPATYDHLHREENLQAVINHLQRHFNAIIIIGEEGGTRFKKFHGERVGYATFYNGKFHRTKMLNEMAGYAKTPIIVNYDADVLLPPEQIIKSVELIRSKKAEFCYPYQEFTHVPRIKFKEATESYDICEWAKHIRLLKEPISVGGCLFMCKKAFLAAGGENENFISWSPEDLERNHRFTTLGYKVTRIDGPLFHLDHHIGINSSGRHGYYRQGVAEWEKVKRMGKEKLQQYISTWEWAKAGPYARSTAAV